MLDRSVQQLDERNAPRLAGALISLWEGLEGVGEAARFARILIGVALALVGQEVDLGPVEATVRQEVARVREASDCLLPDGLTPATADLLVVDYRRFLVRGFYTTSPQLSDYFRATAWLKSIPLRVANDHELVAAWLLARAQALATKDWNLLRSCFSALAGRGDLDLGLFSGQESLEEFRRKVSELPPPVLCDHVALGTARNVRVLAGLALPDSIYFQMHNPSSLPAPAALCGALGSPLAAAQFSGPLPQLKLETDQLFSNYLGVLGTLLEPPPPEAPKFMHGPAWQRKSANTMLAAWAQMRHTWALQAKEVWVTIGFEDYPKPVGFVEPVPKFFRAMAALVDGFRQFMSDAGVLEPDRANLARHMRLRAKELFFRAQAIGADEPYADINRRSFELSAQESLQQAESLESGHDDAVDLASMLAGDPRLKRKWERLHYVCGQLQELASKQLRGERHDEADRDFILGYGDVLTDLMFYEGDTADRPDDDAPRICEIGSDPDANQRLQVGIARPQAIYVLYPTAEGTILCRGSVLPYAEFLTERPMTNEEWRQLLRDGGAVPQPAWLSPT